MDEITRKIQLKELEILKHVDIVCKQLNIKYFLAFGSLIGAVRHKGFIPWDDDMDIWMKREDYDVFLKKGMEYLPSQYFIQHYTTDTNTNNIYIKVRDTNTLFLESDNSEVDMNHGIFIDVFPIERVPKGLLNGKGEFYKRKLFNLINGCYDLPNVCSITSVFKRNVALLIHKFVCEKMDRNQFIQREDSRRLRLHNRNYKYYFIGYFGYFGLDEYSNLDQVYSYQFEDTAFWGPVNADYLLTKTYGNYMKLPPEDKRETHKPMKVVFDLSAGE